MSELRDRGDAELERQGQSLRYVGEILMKYGVAPILGFGTLLGIVREGDFIRWDDDTEVCVKYEHAAHHYKAIITDLEAQGFRIGRKTNNGRSRWRIHAIRHNYLINIFALGRQHLKKGVYCRSNYRMPQRFVDAVKPVTFRGGEYYMPCDHEDYLKHCYGPKWRTPLRSSRKSEYLIGGVRK